MEEKILAILEAMQRDHKEDIQSLRTDVRSLSKQIEHLEDLAFTADEKEDVMTMVKHYSKQLADDELGRRAITLRREEYDKVSQAKPFRSRFAT